MRRSQVCVDANLTLKVVLPEPDRPLALALFSEWEARGTAVIAPSLWAYEVTSVLHNKVHRGLLAPEAADRAFTTVHSSRIELLRPDGLHRRAWQLARYFGRPAAYDSHYLALADMMSCSFWTSDERLFNAVSGVLGWVHWLGDYRPPVAVP